MPRSPEDSDLPEKIAPLSQKQEDLLIELFVRLSTADRKKVIKLCRDLQKAAAKKK
jgi:hypothetical protein